jgi:hypothetical protein
MFVIIVLWTAFFVINFNVMLMIPLLPFIEQEAGLSASEADWCLPPFPPSLSSAILRSGPLSIGTAASHLSSEAPRGALQSCS